MGFISVWKHQTTFSMKILGVNLKCREAQKQHDGVHLDRRDGHSGALAK